MRDHTNTYLEPIRREIESKENLVKVYMDRIDAIPISNDIDKVELEKNLSERTRLYGEKKEVESKLLVLQKKEMILSNPKFVLLIGKESDCEVTDLFPMLEMIESDASKAINDEIRKAVFNSGLILQKGEYMAIAVRRSLYSPQIVKVPDLMNSNNNLYVSSKEFTYDGKDIDIYP